MSITVLLKTPMLWPSIKFLKADWKRSKFKQWLHVSRTKPLTYMGRVHFPAHKSPAVYSSTGSPAKHKQSSKSNIKIIIENIRSTYLRQLQFNENALREVRTCQNLHFDKCVCSVWNSKAFCTKWRCIYVWNCVKICQGIRELHITFHLDTHTHKQTKHQTNILTKIQILASSDNNLTNGAVESRC